MADVDAVVKEAVVEASDLGDYIQGGIPDDEFTDENEVITAKGAAQLHKVMPQTSTSDLEGSLKAEQVITLFTVQNLIDMVGHVRTKPAARHKVRVGIDAVAVHRLQRLMEADEERQARLFTPAELAYCLSKRRCYEHFAARFAAKEAVLKAFGTGISQRMRWTEVEVVNERSGRPRVRLAGAVASFAKRHGLRDLDVSLTHTESLALAHVVTVWTGEPCASR
jgi:holo-[acyl-carrier protein] synthase